MAIFKKVLYMICYIAADLVVMIGIALVAECCGVMAWEPVSRVMTTVQGVISVNPGWLAMGLALFVVSIPFVGIHLTKG